MAQYSGMWTLSQVSQAVKNQTWTGLPPSVVEYLVVAGGGGGENGGGGAGGLLAGHVGIIPGASYFVTVGAGGTGVSNATNGGNSVLIASSSGATTGNIVAFGGGRGSQGVNNYPSDVSGGAYSGGSGGGAYQTSAGGNGTSGQGNAGGNASNGATSTTGGGGGAGTVGLQSPANYVGANGGAGIASAISGTATTYAGGGAGGGYQSIGVGGVGGGGDAGYAGAVNSGGGGGGYRQDPGNLSGAAGGSGIVIIRYPGTTQFFTGGTLSYANGYIIHTFYANGVLAPKTPTLYTNPDYQISRSIRLNKPDLAFFNRTVGASGNRKTWTWSGWVKRTSINTSNLETPAIFGASDLSTGTGQLTFGSYNSNVDTLVWSDSSVSTDTVETSAVFKDLSAWYHIVLAHDSTQLTSTDRVKIYVNGVRQALTTGSALPTRNKDSYMNYTSFTHRIGAYSSSGQGYQLNAYLAEINFIDGQALTPSSFGWTNPNTGVWAPLKYIGTYGTNGYYLNFSDNSNTTAATLGADSSGNGNNWTPNNFSVSAGAGNDSLVDTPTSYGTDTGVGGEVRGNYSTMNPLNKGSTVTLTNGNLDQVTASGGWNSARASIAVASGKWYWEVTITGTSQLVMHGVDDNTYNVTTNPSTSYVGAYNNSWGVYASDGNKRNNTGSGTAYGSAFAQNDVMIVAMDMDSGKIWWGKNGTWFASGDPVAGTNAAYTNLSGYTLNPATSGFDTTDSCTHNFGQRPFAYTAPSGFKALCTQNLPTPTIGATAATLASEFFDASTWAANGDNVNPRPITSNVDLANGGGLIWVKGRDLAVAHFLVDSVRGYTNYIAINSTAAESAYNFGIAGTTNGFTFTTSSGSLNQSPYTYVGWQWKAGGTAVTNTSGSITSTVSANPTSGFSVVTYTGVTNGTVGHGLGVAPSMIIVKSRAGVQNWFIYHIGTGATKYTTMSTDAATTSSGAWNDTAPTSSVFTTGSFFSTNTMLAYCFAPVAGYSAFGTYTGNGSADGPFVHTGFKPAFVMIKSSSGYSSDWWITDTSRNPSNITNYGIRADTNETQVSDVGQLILSNGFKYSNDTGSPNQSGVTYIYAAFASTPFKYSLAR